MMNSSSFYGIMLYICSTDTGTNTEEYITLRRNVSSIINSLRSVVGSKEELYLKFVELDWLGPTLDLSENQLVILVLDKVKNDSRIFHDFVTLLGTINGMKPIADILIKKLHEST